MGQERNIGGGEGAPGPAFAWLVGLLVVVLWLAAAWGAGLTCLRGGAQAAIHGTNYAAWSPQPLLAWAAIGAGFLALTWLSWFLIFRVLPREQALGLAATGIGGLLILEVVFGIAAVASMSPLRSRLALPTEWMSPDGSWSADLGLYSPAFAAPLLGIVALLTLLITRAAWGRPPHGDPAELGSTAGLVDPAEPAGGPGGQVLNAADSQVNEMQLRRARLALVIACGVVFVAWLAAAIGYPVIVSATIGS